MVYIVQSAHWAIESESKQCANILLAIRKMNKNDIGKSHTALANMWIIFRYLLILIFNIIPQWYENRLCMVSIPEISRPDIFASFFNIYRYVSVSLKFIVYGNLNTICILLLSENCIDLNHVESVHSAFQVSYILLLFCVVILLIFESLILKLQLKIFIIYLNCISTTVYLL